jgi:hypothetical protein
MLAGYSSSMYGGECRVGTVLYRGRQDRPSTLGVRPRGASPWTAVLTRGAAAALALPAQVARRATPSRVRSVVLPAWIGRTIWRSSHTAGDDTVLGVWSRRSNKAMQLTRHGWRRVDASSSVVPRSAVIVDEDEVVRASQLIASVRSTSRGVTSVK